MNLHAIAAPFIGAINPNIPAILQKSAGSTTSADGKRTPLFSYQNVIAQVQPMSSGDLRQTEGLNLNGTKRSIYLYGESNSVERVTSKGGDLVTIATGANAGIWLVATELEQWPDWVKVAVTLQNGS